MLAIKRWGSVLYSKTTQIILNLRALSYLFGVVILLASVAYLFLTTKFLIDTDVTFPVLDHWSHFVALIKLADEGKLHTFIFGQINEHRPVILLTAMSIDYLFFGFQLRFMAVFHLLSYGALVTTFSLLTIQIPNELDRPVRNVAKVLIAASGLFLLLNMRQWEVHYGYENVGTIQGFLFFACAIYLYNKRFDWFASGDKVTYASFAAVAFLALLSAASMAFGLLAMPFLFLVSVLRGAPRKESWWLALLMCLFFYVYSIGMNLSPNKNEWLLDPDAIFRILNLAPMMLGTLFTDIKLSALQIGTLGMVLTAGLTIQFVVRKQWNRSILVTVYCILLLSLAYALMVGIGRRYMSDDGSTAYRYMLASAIFWQSLFAVSLYAGLELFPSARRRTLAFFLLVLIAIIINCTISQIKIFKLMTGMAKANAVAVNALQFGVLDKDEFRSLAGAFDESFFSRVKVFKDHQTSIYGTEIAKLYGHKINEKYVVDNSRCVGDISVVDNRPVIPQLVSDSSSMGLKVFGWAWSKQPGVKPPHILLVDQSEVIKGAGLFTVKRPDVAQNLGDSSAEDAGWVAFARLEQGATEINGYAFYEKENVVCLFKKFKFPDNLVVN